MKVLTENLKTFFTLNEENPIEQFQNLKSITKNNPICGIVKKVFDSSSSPNDSLMSKLSNLSSSLNLECFLNKRMIQNLPLMIVDLKDYLIQRRVTKLEQTSKDFLTNSIDYMKACRNYQSSYLLKNLQEELIRNKMRGENSTEESNQIHIENPKESDTLHHKQIVNMINTEIVESLGRKHHKRNLSDMIRESDKNMVTRLDKVNEYWKDSNIIVSRFVTSLGDPTHSTDPSFPIEIDQELSARYQKELNKNHLGSYEWRSQNYLKDDDVFAESSHIRIKKDGDKMPNLMINDDRNKDLSFSE